MKERLKTRETIYPWFLLYGKQILKNFLSSLLYLKKRRENRSITHHKSDGLVFQPLHSGYASPVLTSLSNAVLAMQAL